MGSANDADCTRFCGVITMHIATVLLLAPLTTAYSTSVAKPAAVRFAWGEADVPNLMSRSGLPVAQFRTTVK